MAIDPSFAVGGGEWVIAPLEGTAPPAGAQDGEGFGGVLAEQLQSLEALQSEASTQARALADGTATDVSEVVTAVERARLSMQLASQVRTKAVDALQDIFHTQI